MKNKELVFRLNRSMGQIESIKKSIENDNNEDCLKTLQQLKASINALKKFGEAYIQSHMKTCLKNPSHSKEEMMKMLTDVISASFSL